MGVDVAGHTHALRRPRLLRAEASPQSCPALRVHVRFTPSLAYGSGVLVGPPRARAASPSKSVDGAECWRMCWLCTLREGEHGVDKGVLVQRTLHGIRRARPQSAAARPAQHLWISALACVSCLVCDSGSVVMHVYTYTQAKKRRVRPNANSKYTGSGRRPQPLLL